MRATKTEIHPYISSNQRGKWNLGGSVLVILAAILKICTNDVFSPVRRYLSPTLPFSMAAMCPLTTSST
uniref:Uncharacterized protein n=1 Tax=Arundo donax TaxID=35708 RepID=A0A0A8Z683_ARUDO